jgi:hypothetical protein
MFYASRYAECGGVIGVDGWVTDVRELPAPETWQWLHDQCVADPFLNFAGTRDELEGVLARLAELHGAAAAAVAGRQLVEGADGVFRWRRTLSQLIAIERAVEEEGEVPSSDVEGHSRQDRSLLAHGPRDGGRVQCVRLLTFAGLASAARRPAGVHLVHDFATLDEPLG